MGLIVTAYKSVSLVNAISPLQRQVALSTDLAADKVLLCQNGSREQGDEMPDGFYSFTGKPKRHEAGNYAAYGEWRDALSRLMLGVPAEDVWAGKREGAAFVELIDFSDSSGFFGPKTSSKLAVDFACFADNATRADKAFRAEYAAFQRAFGYAATGGVVKFH